MPDEGPRGGDAQPSLRAAPRPPDPDVNGTKRVPFAPSVLQAPPDGFPHECEEQRDGHTLVPASAYACQER